MLFLLVIATSAITSRCVAQNLSTSPHTSNEDSVRSIIVKFRSLQAMSDSSVLSELRAVSSSIDIWKSVFRRTPVKSNSVQSIGTADTFGLDRIVQIPLQEGITAQDAVHELSTQATFEYVEPNYRYYIQTGEHIPNDPLYYAEWWLANVHAPEAWQITEGDSTIHIGFVDTGVKWLHPDLEFQFAVNPAEDRNHDGLFEAWPSDSLGVNVRGDTVYGDLDGIDHDGNGYLNDVIGYNFIDDDAIPYDDNGHGTAIAGILAGEQDNAIGISGIAPKCRLVALKAFDANGFGQDNNIASAIVYAADNGVQILNCSFGDVVPSLLQRDAIRYAISKGVTIFGSSGNSAYSSEDPNYPSDFDEVVSVGATASYPPDAVWFLTTHGEEMDVVAPGENILTTDTSLGYDSVSGTSAASPIAAGIAALLLSKNPKLTPIQLRSIIESTTTQAAGGYNHLSANGRVDAYAALSYVGTPEIKLVTPQTLDEFQVGDTVHFTGSAISPLFTGYSIDFGGGSMPDTNPSVNNLHNIATSDTQVLSGTLALWDTRGLDTGLYTVRLNVRSSDNRSTEEHCTIRLAAAPPKFRMFRVDSIYLATAPNLPVEEGLVVLATSDLPCQLSVQYAAAGSRISVKADDHLAREHWVMISPEEAQRNIPLAIEAVLRVPNGDTSVMWDTASVLGTAFPEQGFSQKSYSLPSGYALNSILATPFGDEVAETPDATGHLTMFLFDSSKHFRAIDSVGDGSLPRAIGNTVGDNRPELLVQSLAGPCAFTDFCGHTAIYKQNASHSLLGDMIYENDTLFGSTFAQLTPDHRQSIAGSIDSAYQAYKYVNGLFALDGSMVDPVIPNANAIFSGYGDPHAAHADLLGNGIEELITLDNNANLVIYEYDSTSPTRFRPVYIDSNVAIANGAFVTTGDFDGDGKPDIAYAFHPDIRHDSLGEYPFAYWTVKVLRNLGGLKFQTILNANFFDPYSIYNPNPANPPSSSLSRLRNVTGRTVDDLALCFYPNFYLVEYDSVTQTMAPVWRYPSVESPNGAISYDFDKNGKREFGFFTGDSIHFFEHSDNYVEQTPAPASLDVSPRDTNRVDLEWAPVEHATEYFILRAAPQAVNFTIIDSTASTFYSDTTVTSGDDWIYSVAAVSSYYKIPDSDPAFYREVIVHPMPRLISAALTSTASIQVRTSQPPGMNQLHAGAIMIDDTIQPQAITVSADSELVMSLESALNSGGHKMRVTSFGLRDIYNSPFDTADYLPFQVPVDTAPDRFYILRWTFEPGPNGIVIHVIFNEEPAANASDATRYTLTPYGTLVRVMRDTNDANALYISVEGVSLESLGVPFVLCVNNITSIKNTPLSTAGNCAGISLTEPNLSSVMVYPNPAKTSVSQLTFARLTAEADIRIYTLRMRFIREIKTSGASGGVTWDMRDNRGNIVPSGEYLYYVTGTNDAGISVQGTAAKLVIVNDAR